MDVSIIIISWNTMAALKDCLLSIYNNVSPALLDKMHFSNHGQKGGAYETVVVDNGSTDGSLEMLRQDYPQVRVIQNPENYGFARAANQGLRQTTGRYKLILNSDTQITPGALEELVKYLDTHPACALAGPQLINQDQSRPDSIGARQNSFANFPSLFSELLNRSVLELLLPEQYPSKRQPRSEPFTVDSLVGACMMVRSESLNRVGFLDEDYFVFLEETDWCLRMRKKGYQIAVVPAARVYHLQGETKKQWLIPAKIEYLNSLYKFFRKHKSPLSYSVLRILKPLKIMLEFLITLTALIVTFGLIKNLRKKTVVFLNLWLWHLLGCPAQMTLRERQKQTGQPFRVHWLITDDRLAQHLEQLRFSADLIPEAPGCSFELLKNHKVKKLFRMKTPETDKNTISSFSKVESYLLKLYQPTHPFSWLKTLFYGSKAEREFNLSKRIAYRGIPTIVPTAVGTSAHQKIWRANKFSILVTREILSLPKDCSNLSRYLLTPAGTPPFDQPTRKKIIQSYGQLADQIHQKGIRQDDFDPNNILIQFLEIPPGDFKLFLIDLERVKLGWPLSLRERIISLAKLNRIRGRISTTERFRFLRSYLFNRRLTIDQSKAERAVIKTWISKIKEAQDLVMEQNYRWSKKISLWESRNIGRYDDKHFNGFYRKQYPQLKLTGFDKKQLVQFADYLKTSEPTGLPIPTLGRETGEWPFAPVIAKRLTNYSQAKKLWQELNALLRLYRTPVLPVAVLKLKIAPRAAYLLYQPLSTTLAKSSPPIPPFFINPKMEERLTEAEKMLKL